MQNLHRKVIHNLMRSKADGPSISEDINLPSLRKKLPSQYLLQGNLPPSLRRKRTHEDVRKVTTHSLTEMQQ